MACADLGKTRWESISAHPPWAVRSAMRKLAAGHRRIFERPHTEWMTDLCVDAAALKAHIGPSEVRAMKVSEKYIQRWIDAWAWPECDPPLAAMWTWAWGGVDPNHHRECHWAWGIRARTKRRPQLDEAGKPNSEVKCARARIENMERQCETHARDMELNLRKLASESLKTLIENAGQRRARVRRLVELGKQCPLAHLASEPEAIGPHIDPCWSIDVTHPAALITASSGRDGSKAPSTWDAKREMLYCAEHTRALLLGVRSKVGAAQVTGFAPRRRGERYDEAEALALAERCVQTI